MVLWRGLLHESDIGVDALDGCDGLRPVYQGGHGVVYYIPGSGRSTERGKRLLMWGYYLQVPEGALSLVLVDDQERQQSSSVPFGTAVLQVDAKVEASKARLGLLPPLLFELVQQSGNSSIQAVYSVVARSYARDRVCLVGDAGAVFPRSRVAASCGRWPMPPHWQTPSPAPPAVDDGLRRWGEAEAQLAAQVMPVAERIERSAVFGMPDLTTMPTAATNDWMSAAHPGLVVTLPDV